MTSSTFSAGSTAAAAGAEEIVAGSCDSPGAAQEATAKTPARMIKVNNELLMDFSLCCSDVLLRLLFR
jgi:hypothetical protein